VDENVIITIFAIYLLFMLISYINENCDILYS